MLNFKFNDSIEESKHLKRVSDWVTTDISKESLSSLPCEAGLDLSDTKLGKVLSGRKETTLMISRVPSLEWGFDFRPFISVNEVPWNRLTRVLGYDREERFAVREIVLSDGTTVNARIKVPYLNLKGMPVVYVDFVESNENDSKQQGAHLLCKDIIRESFKINENEYEYLMSSGSQLRSLKGVFVRVDYKVPESVLNNIDDSHYRSFVRNMSGARALLEILTYGSYSTEFSCEFADYLKEVGFKAAEIKRDYPSVSTEQVETSLSKFMARVGMALTSSTPFGKDWNVKRIGLVRFKVDNLMTRFANMTFIDEEGQKVRRYSKEELQDIEKFWKEEKLDGQNMIRMSKVISKFKEMYGYEVKPSDINGELIQFRWAGVKGTGLVVSDKYLDACKTPDGEYIYRGQDLIVEDSSWKYSPSKFYTGSAAPEFELVSLSKGRFSSHLNYQFINALDGSVGKDVVTENIKALIDESIDSVRGAMHSQEDFLAKFGIVDSKNDFLDSLGLDTHQMTIKSKSGKIVDVLDEAVHDPYIRRKLLENFKKGSDEVAIGKISVEGANRYIISDPTAMLRTDLAVKGKDGLWHIILDNPNQVAMRESNSVYWNNKKEECVLFRSPCVHPGEPQRMQLKTVETMPNVIPTGYGDLNVAEFMGSIRNIVVINGWCNALESLGGADTDGDMVLCVTDKRVVEMRNLYRSTCFADIGSETVKEVLNTDSLKNNMVFSLKDNGIGLITNYATTWRDIQLFALYCLRNKKRLPSNVETALGKIGQAAAANLKEDRDWVSEDKSLSDLSLLNEKVDDYREFLSNVNTAASAALVKLRELQEMAINTAKSGVFVEFNTDDKEKNNLKHLCVGVRADWHKPNYVKKLRYKSFSPMGIANRYAKEQWEKLTLEAQDSARSMFPDADTYFNAELLDAVEEIAKIKANYGTQVNRLTLDKRNKKITEEEFSLKFGELTEDMHAELMVLSMEYGMDAVALIAYDITYKSARKNGEGASFVWNCFFEEFLHTVKINRACGEEQPLNQRLYPVKLIPTFMYTGVESGKVTVTDTKVAKDSILIGTTTLEDGEYDMVSVDSRCYIKKQVLMRNPRELEEFIKERSIDIRLVGFKYYEDLVSGGSLDKEKIKEYLTNDMGQSIVRVKAVNMDNFSKMSKINFYIRYSQDEEGNALWMPIGTLEKEYKHVSRMLNNKIIKVSLKRAEKEYKSMLKLSIDEILFDEILG